eukprot:Opistho-2@93342
MGPWTRTSSPMRTCSSKCATTGSILVASILFALLAPSLAQQRYYSATPVFTLQSDLFGDAYGQAITAGDFDGDGNADVIAGAPYYTPYQDTTTSGMYRDRTQEGAVYFHYAPQQFGGSRDLASMFTGFSQPAGFNVSCAINVGDKYLHILGGSRAILVDLTTNSVTSDDTIANRFGISTTAFQSDLDACSHMRLNTNAAPLVYSTAEIYLFKGTDFLIVSTTTMREVTGSRALISTRFTQMPFTSNLQSVLYIPPSQVVFFKDGNYSVWDIENRKLANFPNTNTKPVNTSLYNGPYGTAFKGTVTILDTSAPNHALRSLYFQGRNVARLPTMVLSNGTFPAGSGVTQFKSATRWRSWFGSAISSGKTAPNTIDSVVIGAFGTDLNNANSPRSTGVSYYDNGRVYLYAGRTGGVAPPQTAAVSQFGALTSVCQFGFSVGLGLANSTGHTRVVAGAINANSMGGMVVSYPRMGVLNDLGSTPGGSALGQYSSKFGHAVEVTGDFDGNGVDDLVVGSIKGDQTQDIIFGGDVSIFSGVYNEVPSTYQSLTIIWKRSGTIVGGRFGHSLLSLDINADGFDDLFVGAPSGSPGGRVYLFLGSRSGLSTVESWTFDGPATDEEFGYSMAAIGDVNKDGYPDVAIGAPFYDGRNGRVFVFLGGRNGPQATPDEILLGSRLSPSKGQLFGYSLASADFDKDTYPDILVGVSTHLWHWRRRRRVCAIATSGEHKPPDRSQEHNHLYDRHFLIPTHYWKCWSIDGQQPQNHRKRACPEHPGDRASRNAQRPRRGIYHTHSAPLVFRHSDACQQHQRYTSCELRQF